ncbi:phosphatase yqaB [Vibrio sp. JCM 19236]|nr:phosphatase yqaB [Vibrio sp. JCM 19236]
MTATEVENHKPFPDTFLLAAEQMNIQPKDCVVFEDTLLGLQAAHAAGMDCYLVTEKGFEFRPVLESAYTE